MGEDTDYGLAFPLVAATSKGGIYDDDALIAGICLGELGYRMAIHDLFIVAYVYPGLVEQFDLMAMYYGYSFKHEPWEDFPDQWTKITLAVLPRDQFCD